MMSTTMCTSRSQADPIRDIRQLSEQMGKRMKQEIIARTRGRIPLSPPQKKWLGRFVPPPSPATASRRLLCKTPNCPVAGTKGKTRPSGGYATCASARRGTPTNNCALGNGGIGHSCHTGENEAGGGRGGEARGGASGSRASQTGEPRPSGGTATCTSARRSTSTYHCPRGKVRL
ncbi:hypothetical protein C8J57DRAFT_1274908, partial [Mycena rebaudengoi]